jgi:hypothetical protein
MNDAIAKSLYQLTGSGNMDEISINQLTQLTNDHPYFSVGKFLLAKKMKAANDAQFLNQVQQTALYFNNPHWLHFQLMTDMPDISFMPAKADTTNLTENIAVENEVETVSILPSAEEALATESITNIEPETVATEPILTAAENSIETIDQNLPSEEEAEPTESILNIEPETAPVESIPAVEENETIEHAEFASSTAEEAIPITVDEVVEDTAFDLQHHITEEQFELAALAQAEDDTKVEAVAEVATEIEVPADAIDQPIESAPVFFAPNNEEPLAIAQEAVTEVAEATISEFQPYQTQAEKNAEVNDTDAVETEIDTTPIHIPNLAEAAQMLEKAVVDADLDSLISTEPYHTVDYFASQGIKPSLDDNPQDKLGRQVKRFTEWIKHMKQIGSEEALQQINDPVLETTIQNIANTSNSSREIVTETMAEVLVKQGKTDKAIQLYIKLSFLNPDKSAFFASKIQQLKGISQ